MPLDIARLKTAALSTPELAADLKAAFGIHPSRFAHLDAGEESVLVTVTQAAGLGSVTGWTRELLLETARAAYQVASDPDFIEVHGDHLARTMDQHRVVNLLNGVAEALAQLQCREVSLELRRQFLPGTEPRAALEKRMEAGDVEGVEHTLVVFLRKHVPERAEEDAMLAVLPGLVRQATS